MKNLRRVIKIAFTPVTVMMIPHSNKKSFNIKIPSISIISLIILWIIGTSYTFFTAVSSVQYNTMKENLSFYTDQFNKLQMTMAALERSEEQFRNLFSLGSREAILNNFAAVDSGNIDMPALQDQVKKSIEAVEGIKDYIRAKKDLYLATPKGFPIDGKLSSSYGRRVNPMNQSIQYHTGMDLSAPLGTPIRATADGIVSFAGRSGRSGLLIGIEHGFETATFYAHTRKIIVKAGEQVKRGQVIGYVGSTGASTGPHVHYEIWVKGKSVNPSEYM